jgi:hypothetical protein
MPNIDGKDVSPDEAMLLGRCPECGQLLIPKTARAHAAAHWFGRDPNDLWLSEEARRRYKLIIDFAADRYTPDRNGMSDKPVNSANVDKPVARFLETLGGLMIAAGFEWLIFVDHPSWLAVVGFWGGGTATFFAGAFWRRLKFRMPERLVASVETVALDFRYWLALFLFGFVYMGTPILLSQFKPILLLRDESRAGTYNAGHTPTELQLQFNGLGQAPRSITKRNVFHFDSVDLVIRKDVVNPQGQRVMSEAEHKLFLFLVFDKPIAAKDFRIDGNGAVLPMHEIKDQTSRSALIVFDGPVAGTVLNIEAEF